MYPSEKWKLFFTVGDLERRNVALRIVCQHCHRRRDMQPLGLAAWRERHFKGADPTVAQLEAKLSCACKRKAANVTALESWERIGR